MDDDTIEDGFGSAWSARCPYCNQNSMQVVRPGKVQCGECDETEETAVKFGTGEYRYCEELDEKIFYWKRD